MKKLLTLLFLASLTAGMMQASVKDEPADSRVVIAQWNGYTPSEPPADGQFTATEGVPVNKNVAVLTRDASAVVADYAVNTDFIAASKSWADADVTEKYWIATLSTQGCEDLLLTSKQKGSNTGPKDFKIQYRAGADVPWTDLPGGGITVGNDNYVKGIVEDLPLPAALNNQETVALRWLATSTARISGTDPVAAGGVNRLEVIVRGVSNGEGEPTLSNDATLKTLSVGGANILKPNVYDYAYKLAEGTTELPALLVEPRHEGATIDEATKKTPTLAGIADGSNNRAEWTVVAEDGVTRQSYTVTFTFEQTVEGRVFFETCGDAAPATGTRPNPAQYTGWDNSAPVAFDGTADVRATASADSHVWFAATSTTNPERTLVIAGIRTAGKTDLKLSFDLAANSVANNAANAENMHVRVKDLESGTESEIAVPSLPLTAANTYVSVTNLPGIPATGNLQITFRTDAGNTVGYRLDNIQVTEGEAIELSANNRLASLTVSKGALKPAFDPDVLAYSVVLPENETEVPVLTYEVEDAKATARVQNPEAIPGTARVIVTAENGDEKIYRVVYSLAVPAGVWMETFETETSKNSYAAGDYQGTAALWQIAGVVRNDDDNDKKHGLMALRLRDAGIPDVANHFLEMREDKANGAGQISLYHGMYGTHTGGAYTLEVSNDGGATWDAFTAEVEEVPADLAPIRFTANVKGNIRIRITKQGSATGSSINIDDIQITDYLPDGMRSPVAAVRVSVLDGVLRVEKAEAGALTTVFDAAGNRIASTLATEIRLPAPGIYIVKVNADVFKVINLFRK
ncbi:MAG: hypothetical protein LBH61_05135 [Dysgonamonadaceae bacterium]|jgi:hypothetical protein|nr:hypothetical protein [Dysgonamonadaceae bacterium]